MFVCLSQLCKTQSEKHVTGVKLRSKLKAGFKDGSGSKEEGREEEGATDH